MLVQAHISGDREKERDRGMEHTGRCRGFHEKMASALTLEECQNLNMSKHR